MVYGVCVFCIYVWYVYVICGMVGVWYVVCVCMLLGLFKDGTLWI